MNAFYMRKKTVIIEELKALVFVNKRNINNKSIFNLFFDKFKEIYSYACQRGKIEKEDVLRLKVAYNIESYPEF